MENASRAPALLFDVCGVLFDVSGGVECMLRWFKGELGEEEILRRWVLSPAVREFELGEIDTGQFARSIIEDLELPVTESRFIDEYLSWHRAPYPGAIELIGDLSKSYVTASFSNIHQLSWTRIEASGLLENMRYNFPSFRTGVLKPDRDAFTYVIERLHTSPSNILFFDDNQANVEAARGMKIRAHRTRGIDELCEKLDATIGLGRS